MLRVGLEDARQTTQTTLRCGSDAFAQRCHVDIALRPATLTFDLLILNVCSVLGVTRSNSVPNLSEIEQFAAELLRFKYVQFGPVRHLGFDRKRIFTIQRPRGPIMHQLIKLLHNRAKRG